MCLLYGIQRALIHHDPFAPLSRSVNERRGWIDEIKEKYGLSEESLSFLRAFSSLAVKLPHCAQAGFYGSGTLTLWRRRRCRIQEVSSPGIDICPCQSERLPSRLRLFPRDSFLSTVSRLVPGVQYNSVVYIRSRRMQLSSTIISLNNYKMNGTYYISR